MEPDGMASPLATPSGIDRKSTRLNSSHTVISYAVFCLKKKKPRGQSSSYTQKKHCTYIKTARPLASIRLQLSLFFGCCNMLTLVRICVVFFFFNDTATTEIYTLSLHDALPISELQQDAVWLGLSHEVVSDGLRRRSEEHTSELQSHSDLVCRLLLEKKKKK